MHKVYVVSFALRTKCTKYTKCISTFMGNAASFILVQLMFFAQLWHCRAGTGTVNAMHYRTCMQCSVLCRPCAVHLPTLHCIASPVYTACAHKFWRNLNPRLCNLFFCSYFTLSKCKHFQISKYFTPYFLRHCAFAGNPNRRQIDVCIYAELFLWGRQIHRRAGSRY